MTQLDPWYEDAACVLAQMGYDAAAIARMIGRHHSTVDRILLRNGLSRPRQRTTREGRAWTEEEDAFIMKARRAGKSLEQIRRMVKAKFGRDASSTSGISDRILRIESAEENGGYAPTKERRDDKIAAEYKAGGTSPYRLSVKHRVSEGHVTKLLRKRGLIRTIRTYTNSKGAFTREEDQIIETRKAKGWSCLKIANYLNFRFATGRTRYSVRDRLLVLQTSE